MEDLPSNWVTANIESIIDSYKSGFASGKKDVAGGIRHLRMNNISVDGRLDLQLVRTVPSTLANEHHFLKNGDILVCTTNSAKLVGKCAVFNLDGEYVFSNHLTRLRARPEVIDCKYLQDYLWLYWKHHGYENKCKHWVNQSTLPKEELLKFDFPLPPLNEQGRIVDKLDQLLPKVQVCQERLERVPRILKRFRQSVLAAACSGRLTADWRDTDDGPDELPQKWLLIEFGSLITDGPKNGLYKPQSCYGKGTPIVRIDAFYDGEITNWASLKRLKLGNNEREQFALTADDILINRVNSPKFLGKCALVQEIPEVTVYESNMMRLRLDTSRVTPQYATLYLRSLRGLEELRKNAKHAVNQSSINQGDVKAVLFSLPPLSEQHEIVLRVEVLFKLADQLEERYKIAKASVDKLTQSILAKAFRGELVPQDPNDEPATILLEKIRSMKAQDQTKKVSRKRSKRRAAVAQ